MTIEQFHYCWSKGFKIKKILEYLNLHESFHDDILKEFKVYFCNEMTLIRERNI